MVRKKKPLNGMAITKKGNILFFPDIRIKKIHINKLERISIIFTEWDNNKFFAIVKLIYKDGRMFSKDYSKQFRNTKYKRFALLLYAITEKKLEKNCNVLSNLNVCVITILNKNGNVIYQSKKKDV